MIKKPSIGLSEDNKWRETVVMYTPAGDICQIAGDIPPIEIERRQCVCNIAQKSAPEVYGFVNRQCFGWFGFNPLRTSAGKMYAVGSLVKFRLRN